ncbi:MAG: hypothetical protein HFH26_10610 [Clostridiaceae bacterium]|nr:hypothetical protein [Clostridiaceae bacterium]
MEEKKRVRRSAEERILEIDEKIEKFEQSLVELDDKRAEAMIAFDEKEANLRDKIQQLQLKKEDILSPKPIKRTRKSKKQKIADLVKLANKSGLKPEEIAERLGIDALI